MNNMSSKSASFHGVAKILRFNWPWYAAGILSIAGATTLLSLGLLPAPLKVMSMVVVSLGGFWILSSLLVSHLIYDRSGLSKGSWLEGLEVAAPGRIAVFHLGQDEASEALAYRFPAARRSTYDVFDPKKNATDSLQRARAAARAFHASASVDPGALPLKDGELDLACLIFAAHEIRDLHGRIAFFLEVRRVLDLNGRLIVVEHLRDGWNGLAYGPNAFHFLPRKTWIATFAGSRFRLLHEGRCTPFVRIFHLEPAP